MAADYLWFEGIPFPSMQYSTENLKSLRDELVVRDEDVITLSYPKSGIVSVDGDTLAWNGRASMTNGTFNVPGSIFLDYSLSTLSAGIQKSSGGCTELGTHWLMDITSMIHSNGDPTWVQSVGNWERSPWVETLAGHEQLKNQKGPRLFTSHLPIQLFPKSFFNSKAKIIYITRNPRDIVISGFYYWGAVKCVRHAESFDQYLEWFLQGNVPFGSWFDHIRGWLQLRGKENFLMISYEDLHQDARACVEKISQFLGKKLSPEEINSILKNTSFEAMKNNKMSNFTLAPDDFIDHSKTKLMRKGVTGDWKNHFTDAQSQIFDKIYQEKMAGLPQGLFPWES